ncbi:hypothetical protein SAMN02745127_03112 [Oceanospirillum multiglobuliferum]|uniref:Uncharacterized protein n=1 Tax=Oceanospirillum multiglobuliferum TaxID=64969 RepID=A0A1T4SIV1_9GAMM|nr:hypothetical protein [Oceanospirillum multiglobuliferum]OPX54135.1 hypothetical protein BTE48_15720 [Oceanospirillum multiglobuliferum]SKA28129.1 hypothetical protein SAMN02745127_03112 [Oceanospirillum multiglobuliferum]
MSSLELYQRAALSARINSADDKADELIKAAYDPATPDYLRAELQEILHSTFDELYPNLKPTGCDDSGKAYYSVIDIAKALGISPEQVEQTATEMFGECLTPSNEINTLQ